MPAAQAMVRDIIHLPNHQCRRLNSSDLASRLQDSQRPHPTGPFNPSPLSQVSGLPMIGAQSEGNDRCGGAGRTHAGKKGHPGWVWAGYGCPVTVAEADMRSMWRLQRGQTYTYVSWHGPDTSSASRLFNPARQQQQTPSLRTPDSTPANATNALTSRLWAWVVFQPRAVGVSHAIVPGHWAGKWGAEHHPSRF